MHTAFNNAGILFITTLFDLLIFVFLIRIVLVAVRADFYNPVSQFITKMTQAIVTPLRRLIPNVRNIELASVLVVLLLEMLKFCLLGLIVIGHMQIGGLLILALADSLKALLNLFFYAILIQAIMSWVHSGYSPIAYIIAKITAPIIHPFQRIIPPVAGFDISPIPAMLVLQLAIIVVANPLIMMGEVMAFG
jgi:YggT family protein